jgi:glycosyltransferase involved in cell wall biosynthesis
MKILLVHNRYQQVGGEDSVFQAESELLSKHGHDVDHLVFDNHEIRTVFEKYLSGLKAIYNPASAKAIAKKIREFSPDIIHVHNFLPLASPSVFFTAKRFKIPVVLTLHNYRLLCPSATLFHDGKIYEKSIASVWPLDAIWKGVYRNSRIQTAAVASMTAIHNILGTWRNKVDCYIALTQFARDKFADSTLAIAPEKFVVKPNFIKDCGRGFIQRDNSFLFIGRLVEEKGVRTVLEAARREKFNLTIIGDGPLREEVEQAATSHSNISYLGQQPREVVMRHLKRCKALIFPSLWFEGFPITLLEAFSTCTPVIATRLGGMKEIIQEGVNGLLFEPDDIEELLQRIHEIDNNPELVQKLRENARLSYLDRYTAGRNYSQLVSIYEKVIEEYDRVPVRELQYSMS